MAVRFKHSDAYAIYFISYTCFRWLHLFEITKSYDCVYKWFEYLKTKKIEITAFVIMPNHLHIILYFHEEIFDLNKVVSNGKRFIAYEIVRRLKHLGRIDLLEQLGDAITKRESAKGQRHRVFEESFDAKPIFTDTFFMQKLDYIHLNPVRGKWSLVNDYTEYEHSSASFYELGKPKVFKPVHYASL